MRAYKMECCLKAKKRVILRKSEGEIGTRAPSALGGTKGGIVPEASRFCQSALRHLLRIGLRVWAPAGIAVVAALLTGCARPSVSQGRQLYTANGCASCHGQDGRGDGPTARYLMVAPVDLHDASQFQHGTSEDAIAKTLAQGISMEHPSALLEATHHMLLMPQFDHLTETERRSIARYLISLRD